MPRFFFHTETDTRTTDSKGIEYATAREARIEAVRACGELARDAPESFWNSRPWTVTVTDDRGLILWILSIDGMASAASSHID